MKMLSSGKELLYVNVGMVIAKRTYIDMTFTQCLSIRDGEQGKVQLKKG